MKKIEVEWSITPKSGITFIQLTDLNCKNKKEWQSLDKAEQKKRLIEALIDYDLSTVIFNPTYWDE